MSDIRTGWIKSIADEFKRLNDREDKKEIARIEAGEFRMAIQRKMHYESTLHSLATELHRRAQADFYDDRTRKDLCAIADLLEASIIP